MSDWRIPGLPESPLFLIKSIFSPTRQALMLALLLLAQPPLASAVPPEPRLDLSAPRDYGYTMGDLIEHTLTVTVPHPYALETSFLPRPGVLDEWLDVRSVDWRAAPEDGATRYRIRITYQLFKGVRGVESAVVPPLPLRFSGPEALEVKAPEWPFTVTPLIPPNLPDESVAIRDGSPPEPLAMDSHWSRLWIYLAGAALVAGGLIWRKLGGSRRSRPFHRARRELKPWLRGPASPESYRAAARILHQALDETAGHAVFAGELDGFCAVRPAFAELRDELADFFGLSQRLFFTAPNAPVPADFPASRFVELCRRCIAAERAGR
ncbi:hypothetical protein [Methylomagnum sp.]